MEFQYETKEDERECVAFMAHMEGNPSEHILCIRNNEVSQPTDINAALWLYYDGTIQFYEWKPEIATHKFYKGDTVSITF